jgi:uncharacterized protein YjeT (DUF2065 family)
MNIEIIIKVIGTVIVCIGLVFLIQPEIMRATTRFFSKGSRLYLAAMVRFALAVVFMMGAKHCGIRWIIVMFGLIFLLSGLLIFMLGLQKAKGIIRWYMEQPKFISRTMAGIVLAVGLIIVYAA